MFYKQVSKQHLRNQTPLALASYKTAQAPKESPASTVTKLVHNGVDSPPMALMCEAAFELRGHK